jgi:hypothetical protein
MRETDALRGRNAGERTNLIRDQIFDLARCGFHLAAPEPYEIGESRMSSNCGSMFAGQRDRSAHYSRITGVETAGNIDGRQYGNQRCVMAYLVGTKRLADIAIQVDLHGTNVSRTAV